MINLTNSNKFFTLRFKLNSLVYIPAIIFIILVLLFGWKNVFSILTIDLKGDIIFADFQNIRTSVLSYLNGFDPQIQNPFDSNNSILIYPFAWVYIGLFFGLQNQINMIFFILTFILLYILIIGRLSQGIKNINRLLILLLIFYSNSSLILIERGNIDLIIFTITYISLIIPNFFFLGTILTIILKLYTIPLLILFLNSFKKISLFIPTFLLTIYLFKDSIFFSLINAPISATFSYGSKVLEEMVFQTTNIELNYIIINFALILVSISGFIIIKLRYQNFLIDFSNHIEKYNKLFIVGSIVYASTFIITGNFDYRLIFLTLLIPLLLDLKDRFFFFWSSLLVIAMNQRTLKFIFSPINDNLGTLINTTGKVILFILLTVNLINYFDQNFFNNRLYRILRFQIN
jgi:hypothetical protein